MIGLASARESGIPEPEWYSPENLSRLLGNAVSGGTGDTRLPIPQGASVLLKPNWVYHENRCGGGRECLYTSLEFVLSALAMVLDCRPSRITIGDAPIQGCHWDEIVTSGFLERVRKLAGSCPVETVDFRCTIMRGAGLEDGHDLGVRAGDRFAQFDLGLESLLEPVSHPQGRFRVSMYDPDLLAARHSPGRHQYVIAREALDADVILNLPKLKTHRKAGMTGALKNLVGLNGNKEYLPHHRKGGTRTGGDCYPGSSVLKSLAETMLDAANRRIGRESFSRWLFGARIALELKKIAGGEAEIDGGWHGNDTVWRTVLDINRIALYGRPDGTMADSPQRRVLSLTDGLVCGQGDGPLMPEPLPLGVVTFSDSSADVDRLHCRLLGLDPDRLPMVREAGSQFRWPLPSGPAGSCAGDGLQSWSTGLPLSPARLPPGWRREG